MLSEWPTEAEAAALLGTSVKTVLRYANDGKIEMRKRPRPGKKPENVCNPRDLEKLMPAAHVMPPEKTAETALTRRVQNGTPHPWQSALDRIATILSAQNGGRIGTVELTQKLWLNLEEAQAYSGRSRNWLLRMCREGKLAAEKDGGWRIRRASLEAFAG